MGGKGRPHAPRAAKAMAYHVELIQGYLKVLTARYRGLDPSKATWDDAEHAARVSSLLGDIEEGVGRTSG